MQLEQVQAVEAPGVTHLEYRALIQSGGERPRSSFASNARLSCIAEAPLDPLRAPLVRSDSLQGALSEHPHPIFGERERRAVKGDRLTGRVRATNRTDEFAGSAKSMVVAKPRPTRARRRSGIVPADVTAEIHGYSHPDATPTPWKVGREQVVAAETFWISTVRPDGRPHVTPLIAPWHGDAIWFTTRSEERKARNLAESASCILTTGRSELVEGGLDVVLEGAAEQVTDDTQF